MYMNVITTTELRTKTTDLVAALLAGYQVDLVHRSQTIGVLMPKKNNADTPANSKILAESLQAFEPKKKTSYQKLMAKYSNYLQKRYGQGLS